MKWSLIILLVFSVLCVETYAQDNFEFMRTDTPKEYFSNGKISYYYGYDGVYEFWFDNDNLTLNNLLEITEQNRGKPSLSKVIQGVKETLFLNDGSIALYRTSEDYSCDNNPNYNCLYSPAYIRKINKKSLTGNISLYRIDKSIPLGENDIINFPLGAELYSMVVEVPAYDFSTFTDFESLVCIKNEEDICKGVIDDDELDKTALFELNRIEENNEEFLYKDIGNNLIYHVDLAHNILMPYDKSCVTSSFGSGDVNKCRLENLKIGSIKQYRHPNGFIYYFLFFNNPSIDNIIYWINNRGEPFKVYTNNHLVYNFSIFNNTASTLILDKLKNK